MSATHLIGQSQLQLHFFNQTQADQFTQMAANWVTGQLLPMIERIFNHFAPNDDVITIERLEIKIPELTGHSLLDELLFKIEQQLLEQLQRIQLAPANDLSTQVHRYLKDDYTWQLIRSFLTTGTLSWPLANNQSIEQLNWEHALLKNISQLSHYLTSSHNEQMERLVNQLPATALAKILEQLPELGQLALLNVLMMSDKVNAPILHRTIALIYSHLLEMALTKRDLSALVSHWYLLLSHFRVQVLTILQRFSSDSQLPALLISQLDLNQRLALIEQLQPGEYLYLRAILDSPQLWVDSAHQEIPTATQNIANTSEQLWLFTLNFLLVDRGSIFNQQSYLRGLINHMAHVTNISYQTLWHRLQYQLGKVAIDSQLRHKMLQTLAKIPPDNVSQTLPIEPHLANHAHERRLISPSHPLKTLFDALKNADETSLLDNWPANSQEFQALLMWLGQLSAIRQLWAENYSDQTLIKLSMVIEPTTQGLIDIIGQKSAQFIPKPAAVTSRVARVSFWQFTLAYLILRYESEFNRRSYLKALTAHLAMRHNLTQRSVIYEIRNVIAQTHYFELINLINELYLSLQMTATLKAILPVNLKNLPTHGVNPETDLLTDSIIQALICADNSLWQQSYRKIISDDKTWLRQQILTFGKQQRLLQLWSERFSDATLIKLTSLIEPMAHPSVSTVIQHSHYFAKATESSAIKQSLWEFSLAYLIIERGSEFNRQSYLKSLIIHLAARHNLSTKQLIQSLKQAPLPLSDWLGALTEWLDSDANTEEQYWLTRIAQPQHLAQPLSATELTSLKQSLIENRIQWPIEKFPTSFVENLITLLTPFSQSVQPFLAILRELSMSLELRANWLYQNLINTHAPLGIDDWLDALLKALKDARPYLSASERQTILRNTLKKMSHFAKVHHWLQALEMPLLPISQWLEHNQAQPSSQLLQAIISNHSPALWQWLQSRYQNVRILRKWIANLTSSQHHQLLANIYPQLGFYLKWLDDLLNSAKTTLSERQLLWKVSYQQLLQMGHQRNFNKLAQALLQALIDEFKANQQAKTITTLLEAHRYHRQFKSIAMHYRESNQPISSKPPKELAHRFSDMVQKIENAITLSENNPIDEQSIPNETLSIANAGLVLFQPYITMLFERLNLVENKQFVSLHAQKQAVFCLQALAFGAEQIQAPEYQLMLNKVLCGMALTTPLETYYPLPDGCNDLIDGLLNAVIAHWRALGQTSFDGLRKTFIQRSAQLSNLDEHWQLDILPGPFDMLLDQLPWSYQSIKFAWMDKPLFVSWR